jgi:hypothetical protein
LFILSFSTSHLVLSCPSCLHRPIPSHFPSTSAFLKFFLALPLPTSHPPYYFSSCSPF